MRVVQRNLVYVVGLALDLCYEDKLKSVDYFGRFGRVVKVGLALSLEQSTSKFLGNPTNRGPQPADFRQSWGPVWVSGGQEWTVWQRICHVPAGG